MKTSPPKTASCALKELSFITFPKKPIFSSERFGKSQEGKKEGKSRRHPVIEAEKPSSSPGRPKGCKTDSGSLVNTEEVRNGRNSANRPGLTSKIVAPSPTPAPNMPHTCSILQMRTHSTKLQDLMQKKKTHTQKPTTRFSPFFNRCFIVQLRGEGVVETVRFFMCSLQGPVIACRPRYV